MLNKDTKVIMVSTIGAALEFYDFIIYLLLAPIIAELFFHGSEFVSLLETYAIFAIGYFFRPLGGIIIGHFGDKFGRKNAFLFTIFLMTFSTFFIISLPIYATIWKVAPFILLFFRICQGIAIGGEIPCSITFVYEHLPKKKRFTGCALIFTGTSAGILLATVIVTILTKVLTHTEMLIWGWRIPFFFTVINGVIGLYIIFTFTDTPAFLEMKQSGKILKTPLTKLLKEFKLEVFLSFLMMLGSGMLYSTVCLMVPTILNRRFDYTLSQAFDLSLFLLVIFISSTYLGPKFIEKFKRRIPFVIISTIILAAFSIPAFYMYSSHTIWQVLIAMAILALTYGTLCGSSSFIMASCFPTEIRFSGTSTSYNLALAAGGGITPIIMAFLMEKNESITAIPLFIIVSSLFCIISLLSIYLRNKAGKSYYE